MTASFHGHVDIVRMLMEANAQIDRQAEVRMLTTTIKSPS